MRRRRLRLVVVGIVVAALAGIGYRAANILARQRERAASGYINLFPEAEQRLKDFRRVKLQQGRMVWELSAREAQYDEDAKRAAVRGPEITFFADGEERGRLRGERGSVTFQGGDIGTVEMQGRVRVEARKYVVEADKATYDRASDLIVAPGPVSIRSGSVRVEGTEMKIKVSTHHLTIAHEVHATLIQDDDGRRP